MPSSSVEIEEQLQDLVLDGDVERGRRLVGEEQLRARSPARWRSSRAGACRRRTGADSPRAARAAAGMPTRSSSSSAPAPARARREARVRREALVDLQRRPAAPGSAPSSAPGRSSRSRRRGRAARRAGRHARAGPRPARAPSRSPSPAGGRAAAIERSVTLLPEPGLADDAEDLARARGRNRRRRRRRAAARRSKVTAGDGRARASSGVVAARSPLHLRSSAMPSPSEAEAEPGDDDGDAGEDRDPPGGGHEVLAVGDLARPIPPSAAARRGRDSRGWSRAGWRAPCRSSSRRAPG